MVRFLESLGERMVRRIVPSVTADAACGAWRYDSCVSGLCGLPWQDLIRQRQTCTYSNGTSVTWYRFLDCGTCAN